jgi:glycerophosphoryl diester phosphodiesterase
MGMGRLRPGARYAENSIPAFRAALAAGADGVELDVHLSADDDVIVHHDYRLGRTTEVAVVENRHLISQLSARDLTGVSLVGEIPSTIPTLAQVLRDVTPVLGDRELWVELKRQQPGHGNQRLVERSLEILTAHPAWEQVVLRSFDKQMLIQVRRLRRDARVHALSIARVDHAVRVGSRHGFEGVAIFHKVAHPASCGLVRRAGLTVTVGGEPDKAAIDRLLRQAITHRDIDHITTDDVAHALARRAELEPAEYPRSPDC